MNNAIRLYGARDSETSTERATIFDTTSDLLGIIRILPPPRPPLAVQKHNGIPSKQITRTTPHRRARDQQHPPLKHTLQIPRRNQRLRHHGQSHPTRNQQELQQGIDLADLCGPHLGAGQAEIPVSRAHAAVFRREADPAEVERGEGEGGVAAENEDGEPGGEDGDVPERDGRGGHEEFVGEGVEDGAENGVEVEAPREVAVEQVREAGVGEDGEGELRLRGDEEVRD